MKLVKVLATLAALAIGGSASLVSAQAKPVLVVSVSGIEEILGDIGFLTKLAGQEQFGQMAVMMSNPYTQGLDASKPITLVVNSEGNQLKPLGIIPVTDLPRFLETVSQFGEVQEAGNGVYELSTPLPIYVKEQDGFAFVGQSPEGLANLPANPRSLAKGLEEEYDIGIRAYLKNLPDAYKQMALAKIREGVQQQLEDAGDLDGEDAALREKIIQANIAQWESMMNEVDTLTIGWQIDSDAQRTYFEGVTTAIPGTKMAAQMAAIKNIRSNFAGFVMPKAAATVNAVGEMTEADIAQFVAMVKPLSDSAKKEIDKDDDLPDEASRAAAKKLIDQLFDVVEATVRQGKVDLGAAMMLENNTMSIVGGLAVADGAQVEQAIRELAKLAEQDPEFPGIQFDAAKVGQVSFHRLTVDVPEDEDARDVFGEKLDVVVGIGAKAVYFGLGQGCEKQIEAGINASSSVTDTSSPMRMNIALAPIMSFAAGFEENPMLNALADALQEHSGTDNIVITSDAIPNGARYRFEIQEGILKSIGETTSRALR